MAIKTQVTWFQIRHWSNVSSTETDSIAYIFCWFYVFCKTKICQDVDNIAQKKLKTRWQKNRAMFWCMRVPHFWRKVFFLVVFVGLKRLWQNDRTTTTFQCGTKKSTWNVIKKLWYHQQHISNCLRHNLDFACCTLFNSHCSAPTLFVHCYFLRAISALFMMIMSITSSNQKSDLCSINA